jgi:hypothetical protein
LPLIAAVNASSGIDVANTGSRQVRALMLFENHGGRIGFRAAANLKGRITMATSGLDAGVASARRVLADMLIAEGLYPKEAAAMIETWSDSWFEDGTRIFYIVPASLVDETLPLRITPAPAETTRVFVGRVEMATPWMLSEIKSALLARDMARLAARGRFLEPFSRRVLGPDVPAADRLLMETSLAEADRVAKARASRRCPPPSPTRP